MAALAGRKVRIKYDPDGSSAAVIAGARVDTGTITRAGIEVSDKDDDGNQAFLDDVATWAMNATVSGVLKDDTLLDLASDNTTFQALFEIEIDGLGTYAGTYGITDFEVSGEDKEAATFSCSLTSSGAITYTADT